MATAKWRKGRVALRNKIIRYLNNWEQLGCVVSAGGVAAHGHIAVSRNFRYFNRCVFGVSKEGLAILLYPMRYRNEFIPLSACRLMSEWASRGALVGCCMNIGDAWDVVVNDAENYKRKRHTFYYENSINEKNKEKKHGKEAE